MKKTCFRKMKETPFVYRFFDGITTSTIPMGYLLAGGEWYRYVFWVSMIHSIASYFYHVCPSKTTYFLDIELINIMVTERIYSITGNIWIYILCVCSVLFEPTRSHLFVVIYLFMFVITYSSYTGRYMTFYNFYSFCSFVLFCFSCFFHSFGYPYYNHASLSTSLYHFCLGVASSIEVGMYQNDVNHTDNTSELFVGLVRCLGFFLFAFLLTTKLTQEPRRTRGIFSGITATILSPLSVYVIIQQLLYSRDLPFQNEAVHNFMTYFYLAYVVADTIVGHIFYPQYFPLLEGWLHHIITSTMFCYFYFWSHDNIVIICMNCVIEISTIVMCLSRIFYDNPAIVKFKHKTFYHLFLWSRIIMPCFLLVYFFPLYNTISKIFTFLITSLNLYWIIKMSCRSC